MTGKLDTFAPDAAIVHADIDPAEIGKNRAADVPIVGDAKYVIDELIAAVAAEHAGRAPGRTSPTGGASSTTCATATRSAGRSRRTARSPRST